MKPIRHDTLDDLVSPDALARWVGPVSRIEREPLTGLGFSGATIERLRTFPAQGAPRTFVLKTVHPSRDWIARDTGDATGREGLLLDEPRLRDVWDVFDGACLGYSREPDRVGLLMDDLSAHIVPNVREPVTEAQEEALVGSLARLHARFWESEALSLPWLTRPAALVGLLAPVTMAEGASQREGPFFDRVRAGWKRVRELAPAAVARLLWRPVAEALEPWADLPRTILHGDCKVANFAFLGNGRVTAFDWSVVAAAPVALELGWYMAVNATRLAGTKERLIDRYRVSLRDTLARPLTDDAWTRQEAMAVTCGALTLLWSKGLGLEEGTARARAEWDWWISHLEPIAASM